MKMANLLSNLSDFCCVNLIWFNSESSFNKTILISKELPKLKNTCSKNLNSCFNTKITFYLETSSGQNSTLY